jgi:hypothetical protein
MRRGEAGRTTSTGDRAAVTDPLKGWKVGEVRQIPETHEIAPHRLSHHNRYSFYIRPKANDRKTESV